MADIKDWGKFVRGRWDWTRFGYEKGFPRGCQFTDVDAAVEFDGARLVIEPKHYDGVGPWPGHPDKGQMLFLQDEAALGKKVFVLWGCGACNDPYAILEIRPEGPGAFHDWRDQPKDQRRRNLKRQIDGALGLDEERWTA
jgi:hypothetical protein